MTDFFPMPGCRVDQVALEVQTSLHIAARGPAVDAPIAGGPSQAVHSRYRRKPADLPSLGRQVHAGLQVRRFYCRNTKCARRTFAEGLPELVEPYARRTCRLAETQGRVGVALGGGAGAKLAHCLAMPASADTVLRLIRRLPLPEQDTPRAVGVDDRAMRKGRTQGTVVVDRERQCVADLLSDRTAATVAAWKQQRPGIEVVARDRSTEYARATAVGAPKTVQAADRWHLLSNVRVRLERWLARAHGRLRRLPVPPGGDGHQPDQRTRAYRRSATEDIASANSRARWLAAYEDVRRRHLAGEELLAISRSTGLAHAAVRKYAHVDVFPERAVRPAGRSNLSPYAAHLEARLAAGFEDAMVLWREVQTQGYAGGRRMVQRWVAGHRSKPATRTAHKWLRQALATTPSGTAPNRAAALPSPKPPAALQTLGAAAVTRVEQDKEAARAASLARRFTALVRGCGSRQAIRSTAPLADPDVWLAEAHACGIGDVETFAAGLKQDRAAVRAALTLPWSSGQAEGQINRLKLLKRQSHGRASFDPLRRRGLMAA